MVFLDDLKDIPILVAEEESFKRRFPQGLNQRGAVRLQPLFQLGKLGAVERDSDVPAKLSLEPRGFELGILDQMQLLPGAIVSQAAFALILPGRATGLQPSTSWKKSTDRRTSRVASVI